MDLAFERRYGMGFCEPQPMVEVQELYLPVKVAAQGLTRLPASRPCLRASFHQSMPGAVRIRRRASCPLIPDPDQIEARITARGLTRAPHSRASMPCRRYRGKARRVPYTLYSTIRRPGRR